MKHGVRILLSLLALLLLVVAGAWIDGLTLPENHTTTVSGTIPAPPEKVFARITDIAAAPRWCPAVKSVTVLPPEQGPNGKEDHWIEDLGHGQTMTFLATKTTAPTERDVLLAVPGASYGGTWTYNVAPGPTPGTTTLSITEAGYIHPAFYRFIMHHLIGMTYNLDTYMSDMRRAAPIL